MNLTLDVSLWKKFAKHWQPASTVVKNRGGEFFVDIGEVENNPIMDEKFDIDDELDALFGRD